MKNLYLVLLLVLTLLVASCTVNEITDKQTYFEKSNVDPIKVKPPTGG